MTKKIIILFICLVMISEVGYAQKRKGSIGKEYLGGFIGMLGGIVVAGLPTLVYLPFRENEIENDEGFVIAAGISTGMLFFTIPYGTALGIHKFGNESGSFHEAYKGSWLGLVLGGVPCGPFSYPLLQPAYGVWFYEKSKSRPQIIKTMKLELETPTGSDEVEIEYEK
ncbi:MAG: hypothetical protein ABIK61_06815 [candidate division WOR-3 bacterium]